MHQTQIQKPIPCSTLPVASAFVAFQTSPGGNDSQSSANNPQSINGNHLPRDLHSSIATPQSLHTNHQINQNQLGIHHHASQPLQAHESPSSRYLWDPAAVANANFHHPSAHGYVCV